VPAPASVPTALRTLIATTPAQPTSATPTAVRTVIIDAGINTTHAPIPALVPIPREQPQTFTSQQKICGASIKDIALAWSLKNVPAGNLKALEEKTREDHRATLKQVARAVQHGDCQRSVAHAAVNAIENLRETRAWRWSTADTKAAALAGALKRASQYTEYPDINLGEYTTWKDYTNHLRVHRTHEERDVSDVADKNVILQAVRNSKDDLALGHLLAWMTVHRPSSIAMIYTRDITVENNGATKLVFRHGKTWKTTGTYFVPTTIPKQFVGRVRALVAARAAAGQPYLFVDWNQPGKPPQRMVNRAVAGMRTATGVSGLAIRRGAAQHLQEKGVAEPIIRLFTKHTTNDQLRAYLAPKSDEKQEQQMKKAADLLGAGEGIPHRNIGCPSWHEMKEAYGQTLGEHGTQDRLPLHLKHVTVIDIDKLDILARECLDNEIVQRYHEAKRVLTDPTYYEALNTETNEEGLPRLTMEFDDEDMANFVAADHAVVFNGKARGWVRLKTREELDRKPPRRRCLGHTVTVNELPRLTSCPMSDTSDAMLAVHSGEKAFTVDYKQWFSQFGIPPALFPFYCFHYHGVTYALKRMQMGGRQSCDLAQVVAEMVAMVAIQRAQTHAPVQTMTHVDNSLFCGTTQDLVKVAQTLVEVTSEVGAQLNDVEEAKHIEILDELEFTGLVMNWKNKTARLGPKIVAKLQFTLDNIERVLMTKKILFATFGLLYHVHAVTRGNQLPLACNFWKATRFLSHIAYEAQENNDWEGEVEVTMEILHEILSWTRMAIGLGDFSVTPGAETGTRGLDLFCDASATGWGAALLDNGDTVREFKGPWEEPDKMQHSTEAEPKALQIAVEHARPNIPQGTRLNIWTDHLPLVYAFKKGTANNFRYNNAIRSVFQTARAHKWRVVVQHIAGSSNEQADKLSRAVWRLSPNPIDGRVE